MLAHDRIVFLELKFSGLGARIFLGDIVMAGIGAAHQFDQDSCGVWPSSFTLFVDTLHVWRLSGFGVLSSRNSPKINGLRNEGSLQSQRQTTSSEAAALPASRKTVPMARGPEQIRPALPDAHRFFSSRPTANLPSCHAPAPNGSCSRTISPQVFLDSVRSAWPVMSGQRCGARHGFLR